MKEDSVNDYQSSVFLLGGHDLEMEEIANILNNKEITFYDRGLEWGAKLSAYADLFDESTHFMGVELSVDIPPPRYYTRIDHHNELSHLPSSLEQVASLLKIELSREQQLIAANDRGYIPAMEQIGASRQEIKEIRRRDRKAQGVSEEDERLAEIAIKKPLERKGDIIIVNALSPGFSPITDRLFPYHKLMIIYGNHFIYYGPGITQLSNYYKNLVGQKKAFYGGGEEGFFGLVLNAFAMEEAEEIKNEVINIIIAMHSYHIFLFPFKWDIPVHDGKKAKVPIFDDVIKTINPEWKPKKSEEQDDISYYNQTKYFHDFVNDALFEKMEKDKCQMREFEYSGIKDKDWKYKISINRRDRIEENEPLFADDILKPPDKYTFTPDVYILTIDKVTLNLYKQGVGLFAFHLKNTNYSKPEDILLINQFGRRIYPPFLDAHYPDFGKATDDKEKNIANNFLEGTQYRELPIEIEILNSDKIAVATEGYHDFKVSGDIKGAKGFLYNHDYLPSHIGYFLGIQAKDEKKLNFSVFSNKIMVFSGKLAIQRILDDRMFVISWYGAEQLGYDYRVQKKTPKKERKDQDYVLSDLCQRMRGGYEVSGFYRNDRQHRSLALNETHDSFGYADNEFWYQYVFVDGYGPSCANSILRQEQIENHTYARWVSANTLYGISRYSFVCITEPQQMLNRPFPNAGFVVDHIQTIYFRMVSMVLAQRAMILRFSEKINQDKLIPDYYLEDFQHQKAFEAYAAYQKFINEFFYREVTAQEQGIELYDMLQKHLRVEYQAKELEKEYNAMYQLINMGSTKKTNERIRIITILGSCFVVPSFILSLLNNRFFNKLEELKFHRFNELYSYNIKLDSLLLVVFLVGIAGLLTPTLLNWMKPGKKCALLNWLKPKTKVSLKRKTINIILISFILFIFIVYLFLFQFTIGMHL